MGDAGVNRQRRIPDGVKASEVVRRSLDAWQAAVVRLSRLDPVTTELVRLRCARYHNCHT
jgi:hypothetical protein